MPSSSFVEVAVKVGVEVEVEVGICSLDGVKILFWSVVRWVGGKMN